MTLLELMAAMAIAAIIMLGVISLVYSEARGTAVARTSVTAGHEISYAARWLSQDGWMAESTNLVDGADSVDHLTLNWIERRDFANIPHCSSYYLSGTQLLRDYDGTVQAVAGKISNLEFSLVGSLITVSIDCSPEWAGDSAKTVRKTYRIYLRAANEEVVW
jgi:hypothetical protein